MKCKQRIVPHGRFCCQLHAPLEARGNGCLTTQVIVRLVIHRIMTAAKSMR
jgi:hypothetical protein